MLDPGILTWHRSDSQVRAEDHQKQLLSSMDTLLKNNEALAQIFLGPDAAQAPVTWSRRNSTQHFPPDRVPSESETPGRNRRSLFDLSFEKDLITSRVYRRIRRETMDFSMRSSVARSNGWSIFSGMSLSDISEISVLALPLRPSDINNPQHYVGGPESQRAGELSLLPPSVYGSSIFHECVGLEAQLVQLKQCSFKQMLQRERMSADDSPDILAALIAVFLRGRPLLQLYNQLDNSYQDRWTQLLSKEPSPSAAKLAVVEFIQACVTRQGMAISGCFTVTDLMDDDATRHIRVRAFLKIFDAKVDFTCQVIRLVRQITSRLVDARVIDKVNIDSLPRMRTPEGPQLAPLLAIVDLVREERVYVVRLECLTQLRDQFSHGNILAGDLVAANDLLSISQKLIHAQLRFLVQLEGLALSPYKIFHLLWFQLFRSWANMSKDIYARFCSGEKHAKRALQAALSLEALSLAKGVSDELSGLVGDAIGTLSMPSQRLQKYRAFLEVNSPPLSPNCADMGPGVHSIRQYCVCQAGPSGC